MSLKSHHPFDRKLCKPLFRYIIAVHWNNMFADTPEDESIDFVNSGIHIYNQVFVESFIPRTHMVTSYLI